MSALPIAIYGNSILRSQGQRVKNINDDLKELAQNMIENTRINRGIGLAAQQVSRHERIIIIDLSAIDENEKAFALINPEIVKSGHEKIVIEEGCLSFPGLRLEINRPTEVMVKGLNLDGKPVEINADGMLARVLQHEIDHNNGILFIDYIHPLKRKFVLKKWEKSKEASS